MTATQLWRMARRGMTLAAVSAVALAGAAAVSARAGAPTLVGVSIRGTAVLIEATAPAAYTVNRPDARTMVVRLRGVSVARPAAAVAGHGDVAGVRFEPAQDVDGAPVGLVRLSFVKPVEATVRSVRNVLRVEWTQAVVTASSASAANDSSAKTPTTIESVKAASAQERTVITLGATGPLNPASVSETADKPRRLVLDFPNVLSRAAAQTIVQGPLVTKVRVGINSRSPLVTRVVMEIAEDATYHVERQHGDAHLFSVIFESARSRGIALLPPAAASAPVEPEPAIPVQVAIQNAASITPPEVLPDALSALQPGPSAQAPSSPVSPSPRAAAPPQTPSPQAPPAQAPPPPARPVPSPATQGSTASLPAPESQQTISQQFGGAEKKYTGSPITLDFAGADLRAVLRYFSEISGLNIVIDPQVPSTPIDVVLRDVPWDQAFETLLRGYKLGYVADGTIVRIAPLSVLAEEEGERLKLSEAKALAGDLRVQTFSLSYAKAADMQPLLVKSALSKRGQIQVDPRTNTLIVMDLPDRLQMAASLITALDRPEPQVEVEARIVQTTREFAKAIGVQWGLNGRMTPDIGNTTNLAFPNSVTLGGRTSQTNAPNDPRAGSLEQTGTAVNLRVPGASSAIGLALGAVNGAFNLDVALTALERSGKGRVLSTPRLTTQNNVVGEVAQGIQIPIQTVANNTVTVSFKDATLILRVTPQITSANTVIMQVEIENATADFSREVNGIPPIDTQRAKTQVQINDGATTIIGGIFVSREQNSQERTPALHRLPLLGWLFKRDAVTDESRELLIFITPRILRG